MGAPGNTMATFDECSSLKDEGDALFKGGEVADAVACYVRAVALCEARPEEGAAVLVVDEEEAESLSVMRCRVLSNLALCRLRQSRFHEAEENCTSLLESGRHMFFVKALFRRAEAR